MKKIFTLYLFVYFLFAASAETVLLEQNKETFLPIKTKKTWKFPAVGKDKRVTVELEHRLDYPTLGGWTSVMQLALNGKRFAAMSDDQQLRLLNKPAIVKHRQTNTFKVCAGTTFNSLYSPNFESGKSGFAKYNTEAYRIVLDITDIVRQNKENILEIKAGGDFLEKIYKDRKIDRKPGIIIRNLKVLQGDEPSKLKILLPVPKFTVTGKTLLDSPKEVRLKVLTAKKWTFPPVEKGKRITVEVEHRIHHPKGGGWNPCVQLAVNNQLVTALVSRKMPRLLNKGHHIPHKQYRFFNVCDAFRWYSVYAPDFDYDLDGFAPLNYEAYRLVLDVTDLVFTDKNNDFEVRFGASWMTNYYRTQKLGCEPALCLRNVKVVQADVPSKIVKNEVVPYITMKTVPAPVYSIKDGADAMTLTIGKLVVPVRSSFSTPGKKKELAFGKTNGKLTTSHYTITRKSVRHSRRIDIFDTLENTSKNLIGIRITYDVPDNSFNQIRIGGNDSPESVLHKGGQNPATWLGDSKSNVGIGLIAVDDVFRVQNQQFIENGRCGIRTENFALSPGEKRIVEWSIYPVATADYFDFVNEVRRDWKVNFTIEGNFAFSVPARYRGGNEQQILSREYGVKFHSTGILSWNWTGGKYSNYVATLYGSALFDDYCRGRTSPGTSPTAIESKPMRDMLRESAKSVKASLKGTGGKVLCYAHTQISTEIDDWKKYPDSIITRANGKYWLYGSGNSSNHIMLPTPNNAFGKKTMTYLKSLVDDLGFDGIYNDEFTHCGPRITYGHWDKVSVELDANNNVKRKIGYVPLLKLPFNLWMLEEFVTNRKSQFVANFSPQTRSELKYHIPRFEETVFSSMPLATHLYTPIQLGDHLSYPMTAHGMMDDIRHALKNGLLYFYYINRKANPIVTKMMFPFTPIEIHSGWLLGKERILTIHSGEYGWPGESALCQVFISDGEGKTLTNPNVVFFPTKDGTLRCRLKLQKEHCAVLVKIPVSVELSDNATLENVSFENGVFSALLKGKGAAKIKTEKAAKDFTVNGGKTEIRL